MNTSMLSSINLIFRSPVGSKTTAIRYAVGQTNLGQVLVGHSGHGICAIFLDDTQSGLMNQLDKAFPQRQFLQDSEALGSELEQVVSLVNTGKVSKVLDLDVGGTIFQQKVWAALQQIPAGQTRTYSDVAGEIGNPDAVRAVAGACAANVLAIAIPCHRVVRQDGSISGYRWGVDRKRALLEKESC
ncbi:methylated-DNA--[protein]-cysteine S-methyltransferase [Pseudomonas kurunegalensis]|uniref:methylated-DNA--[protein]-cysteine S-methyltransferase n=1 Tax=Pseudomonas kurunegalensis TaxID=485880 RepID=UPI002570BE04|nr:methylated-DNA--[protein]-cysteine S-methyltransferase [Pseudomonas kurunegalensis]WJD60025.1 methylated-DNA--[protein]-cysteine S-methyltransferase [Pseudomonas kurunegalensis]